MFRSLFSAESKAQLKKKFYLLSLFLLPRILKHNSQYARQQRAEYIFICFLLPLFFLLLNERANYSSLLILHRLVVYSPCDSPTLYITQQQPFLFMLLIYYVNQLTLTRIFALLYAIRLRPTR